MKTCNPELIGRETSHYSNIVVNDDQDIVWTRDSFGNVIGYTIISPSSDKFHTHIIDDGDISTLDEEYQSYREWNRLGRRIRFGERAKLFRDGEPYFSFDQTYEPSKDNGWLKTSSRFGVTGPWDNPPH